MNQLQGFCPTSITKGDQNEKETIGKNNSIILLVIDMCRTWILVGNHGLWNQNRRVKMECMLSAMWDGFLKSLIFITPIAVYCGILVLKEYKKKQSKNRLNNMN